MSANVTVPTIGAVAWSTKALPLNDVTVVVVIGVVSACVNIAPANASITNVANAIA